MKVDRLFEHYERLIDAPDAVPKLRKMIVDLAVCGKLVEQDSKDESAEHLLARINKEKQKLISLGVARKQNIYSDNIVETLSPLPSSWKWVVIDDVFLYDAGIKRNPETLDANSWLLELEDIEKDSERLLNRVRVREREAKSTKSEFQTNDILYGKLRPYLNKVLVADQCGYSTTEIVSLRPYLPICSNYCTLALRRSDFVKYVTRIGQGTKMPRLRTEDAKVAAFPLPPLAEQHRIVAKVEELMTRCDELEEKFKEREHHLKRFTKASFGSLTETGIGEGELKKRGGFVVKNIDRLMVDVDQIKSFRQSIFDLAVHGRLVEQDPNDENASLLLERMAEEKKRLVNAGEIKIRKIRSRHKASNFNYAIPQGWMLSNLGEIAIKITDGTHKTPTYVTSGVPFVSVKDFSAGKLSLRNTRLIKAEEHKHLYERCDPRRGDILLSRIGTLGKAVLVDSDAEFSLFVSVALIKFDHRYIIPEYMLLYLNSPLAKREFDRIKVGGATHTNKLNLGDLHTVAFPIPPLTEQSRIVSTVESLMRICEELERNLHKTVAVRNYSLESCINEVYH